jgi:hypothetical protein
MDKHANRTGDSMSVRVERLLVRAKHCRGGWRRRGKDDRKQNKLAPLVCSVAGNKMVLRVL